MSFVLTPVDTHTCIYVHGDREPGGEFHTYAIHEKSMDDGNQLAILVFQHGPIKENGVNGINVEDLINICVHRLACFQTGPYACPENEEALTYLKLARHALDQRTKDRHMRGVEGTSKL